ncbi:hypothetical protein C9J85_17645 [Haloferax sp. wsp5]|nr:hypothetical protein C9J85_17645 [Haloferax sp. wsp5]
MSVSRPDPAIIARRVAVARTRSTRRRLRSDYGVTTSVQRYRGPASPQTPHRSPPGPISVRFGGVSSPTSTWSTCRSDRLRPHDAREPIETVERLDGIRTTAGAHPNGIAPRRTSRHTSSPNTVCSTTNRSR